MLESGTKIHKMIVEWTYFWSNQGHRTQEKNASLILKNADTWNLRNFHNTKKSWVISWVDWTKSHWKHVRNTHGKNVLLSDGIPPSYKFNELPLTLTQYLIYVWNPILLSKDNLPFNNFLNIDF